MPTLATPDLTGARQAWRLFHADTKAAIKRREMNDRLFEALFPGGHTYSLRDLTRNYAEQPNRRIFREASLYRFLKDVHPRAFGLMTEYGLDYVPESFDREVYDNNFQPVIGQCFRNARLIMDAFVQNERDAKSPVVYVEGVVFGPNANPMLHGWNSREGSKSAYDWTYYATTQWTRYLGIPFTYEEYEWLRAQASTENHVVSFFRRERFPTFEPYLLEVLRKRTTNTETPAA